jgi:lipopolysaccharide export system permease protein
MIFERAARREFAQAAAGISVALLAILTLHTTDPPAQGCGGRSHCAGGGRVAARFCALNFMPVLLSLTLFVSILLTLVAKRTAIPRWWSGFPAGSR